jgi:hypothetical protein
MSREQMDEHSDGRVTSQEKAGIISWIQMGLTGLLLALLGFGIISALYDWKRTLEVTAFTIAAATLVPSVFYLPCFVFHAIRLRSMAKAREHTWENWKSVAGLVINLCSHIH